MVCAFRLQPFPHTLPPALLPSFLLFPLPSSACDQHVPRRRAGHSIFNGRHAGQPERLPGETAHIAELPHPEHRGDASGGHQAGEEGGGTKGAGCGLVGVFVWVYV